MSLFEGSSPDPVELSKSSTTKVPDYLTNYLTGLSQAGMGALGTVTPGTAATGTTPGTPPTVTPFTGEQLIAQRPEYYTNLLASGTGTMPRLSDLTRYQTAADDATRVGGLAEGVEAADISKFYDPFQQDVVNELARQSALNVQRNVLPSLRGAFAGQGAFGSQRYAGATGQALGDIQASLLGKQSELMSAGYKNALEAALREQATQQGLVGGLSSLASVEATAAPAAIKQLADIGVQDLAYNQSKLEAPLRRAMNVAEIMRGYTYPTSLEETKEEIPTAYGPSALQQIAGLGTLVGAAFPKGGQGVGDRIINALRGAVVDGQLKINMADLDRIYNEAVEAGDAPVSGADLNEWLEGIISGTSG